jgi:hypothetical protein
MFHLVATILLAWCCGVKGNEWVLGYSTESCTLTCGRLSGQCDANKFSDIITTEAFNDMVTSAYEMCSGSLVGDVGAFCNQGVNVFRFAQLPATFTYKTHAADGDADLTLCTFPTSYHSAEGGCDVQYQYPPAQRFCPCTVTGDEGPGTPTDSSSPPQDVPTANPSAQPTAEPSAVPPFASEVDSTAAPTISPTASPTALTTAGPSAEPSATPTAASTVAPTDAPTISPAGVPTTVSTADPTAQLTAEPATEPSVAPTPEPTADPTAAPTTVPMNDRTVQPTVGPSAVPTTQPTVAPTVVPTVSPTAPPSAVPTAAPTTQPMVVPSVASTVSPAAPPSAVPTVTPTTQPMVVPTVAPTVSPTAPPSAEPTVTPTTQSTVVPTVAPTANPTAPPSAVPTVAPTTQPTVRPTVPSIAPTAAPTAKPTYLPAKPSAGPSAQPTIPPSGNPTRNPSAVPSTSPPSLVATMPPIYTDVGSRSSSSGGDDDLPARCEQRDVTIRWHYSISGSLGSWSGGAAVADNGRVVTLKQSMEGDLRVAGQQTINYGYAFALAGAAAHEAPYYVSVTGAQIVFPEVQCGAGTPLTTSLVLHLPDQTYLASGPNWYPSSDQYSSLVYQGSAVVSSQLCPQSTVRLKNGGVFSATVETCPTVPTAFPTLHPTKKPKKAHPQVAEAEEIIQEDASAPNGGLLSYSTVPGSDALIDTQHALELAVTEGEDRDHSQDAALELDASELTGDSSATNPASRAYTSVDSVAATAAADSSAATSTPTQLSTPVVIAVALTAACAVAAVYLWRKWRRHSAASQLRSLLSLKLRKIVIQKATPRSVSGESPRKFNLNFASSSEKGESSCRVCISDMIIHIAVLLCSAGSPSKSATIRLKMGM